MPNFFRFPPRRRLLLVAGVPTLLFGVLMLLPYPRQFLFGPTIRGKPWCVWEDILRHHVHRNEYEGTSFAKAVRWLGFKEEELNSKDFDHPEMLPLFTQLLDDRDPKVSRLALDAFWFFKVLRKESALPAL